MKAPPKSGQRIVAAHKVQVGDQLHNHHATHQAFAWERVVAVKEGELNTVEIQTVNSTTVKHVSEAVCVRR